ncbi:uncharacterized protein PAN0_001d0054 [Moesziomyces antarcticus]|uniref:Uncharacterized protein n=1 Tax=Pseudozyma antarctica TaxID=84753 RepID=A0A5C3FFA4_PSEA2|nr:uncharacterized protein PAN0_001d0054 [Moesziomyces antarcticus]GAK61859.1 conserved hypothetical protein [Moesziomyces antarcticus]SPO42377.1 uncharacterized protein PSANT_00060 [Moesziomyces antarcticus]
MKLNTAITAMYLTLTGITSAAPLMRNVEAAEVSLPETMRSFDSHWSELDDKVQEASQKKALFGTREKWITGVGAGLTLAGTGGYIASSVIPMQLAHRQDAAREKLQAAVARADAAKQAEQLRSAAHVVKREFVDAAKEAQGALEHVGDNESFASALSRSPSERLSELDEIHPVKVKEDGMHRTLDAQRPPPLYVFDAKGDLASTGYRHELYRGMPSSAGSDPSERLAAVEAAVLSLKQHHYEGQKLSPSTKALLGVGLVGAVGGLASAELAVQSSVEGVRRANDRLPDVTNLDPGTCAHFATELPSLDCSKAHGRKLR